MQFSIGYNFNYTDFYKLVIKYTQITEVFFPYFDEMSGREPHAFSNLDRLNFIRNLRYIKKSGKKLNLLLNSTAYNLSTLLNVNHFIDIVNALKTANCFPDIITVSIPYVGYVLKQNFPSIDIRASIMLDYQHEFQFEQTKKIFDSYYISMSLNRKINKITKLKDWFVDNKKKLCMLVNSPCFPNCAFMNQHSLCMAQYEQKFGSIDNSLFIPCKCKDYYDEDHDFMLDFIKGTWIRPIDVCKYDGLCDVMKLSTRDTATIVEHVIDAYMLKHNVQNLSQLFHGKDMFFNKQYIDLTKYPSDYFEHISNCTGNCDMCNYCNNIANVVIQEK